MALYIYLDERFNKQTGDFDQVEEPIVIGVEESVRSMMNDFVRRFWFYAGLLAMVVLLITVSVVIVIRGRVSRPVKRISKRMESFVSDREKDFEPLPVRGRDEFAVMSSAFNSMAEQIDDYLANIEQMTKEKHTQAAELELARNIQMGLLRPNRFTTESASISTYLRPAKNVGGDLYEYEVLDDGRVYIMIGDVSGKGITAAIFMARAVTLLHQYAILGQSPKELMDMFNQSMVDLNPEALFITAFVAIYDPSDHSLTYSNAGHNFPYVISDGVTMLEDAHGCAAGMFDEEEYTEKKIVLKKNDVVFLYTDGVNEAKNGDELFGTEKLESVLKGMCGRTEEEIVDGVLKEVEDFVSGAEQSDDLTILTLRVL